MTLRYSYAKQLSRA